MIFGKMSGSRCASVPGLVCVHREHVWPDVPPRTEELRGERLMSVSLPSSCLSSVDVRSISTSELDV